MPAIAWMFIAGTLLDFRNDVAVVPSPSNAPKPGTHLMTEFAAVCTEPVGQSYREDYMTSWLAAAQSFKSAVDLLPGRGADAPDCKQLNATDTANLLAEKPWFDELARGRTSWTDHAVLEPGKSQMTLGKSHGEIINSGRGGVLLSLASTPERPLVTKNGLRKPAFGIEAKSVGGTFGLWQAGAYHCLANIIKSYFVLPDGRPLGNRAFYTRPPIAYCLCAAGMFVVVCLVELVGRLFMTPISQPHFIGSSELQLQLSRLPQDPFTAPKATDADSGRVSAGAASAAIGASTSAAAAATDGEEPFVVDPQQAVWHIFTQPQWRTQAFGVEPTSADEPPHARPHRPLVDHFVQWTGAPYVDRDGTHCFLKMIDWGVYSAQQLREMTAAYAALQAAYDDKEFPPPPSIVPAQLLFGDCRLLVRTPFLSEYESLPEDDDSLLTTADTTAPVVKAVADALEWLMYHDLLYTDMRAPNVMRLKATAPTPAAASPATGSGGAAAASAGTAPPPAKLIDYDDCKHIPGLKHELMAARDADAALRIVNTHLVRHRSEMGYCPSELQYSLDETAAKATGLRAHFHALPALLKAQLQRRIDAAAARGMAAALAAAAALSS